MNEDVKYCHECHGAGTYQMQIPIVDYFDEDPTVEMDCETCDGTGVL